jgi:hypothetical protein
MTTMAIIDRLRAAPEDGEWLLEVAEAAEVLFHPSTPCLFACHTLDASEPTTSCIRHRGSIDCPGPG